MISAAFSSLPDFSSSLGRGVETLGHLNLEATEKSCIIEAALHPSVKCTSSSYSLKIYFQHIFSYGFVVPLGNFPFICIKYIFRILLFLWHFLWFFIVSRVSCVQFLFCRIHFDFSLFSGAVSGQGWTVTGCSSKAGWHGTSVFFPTEQHGKVKGADDVFEMLFSVCVYALCNI